MATYLLGIGLCGILPAILGIIAIIAGLAGRRAIKKDPKNVTGDGIAIGGIVMGIISMVIGIGLTIVYIIYAVISVLVFGATIGLAILPLLPILLPLFWP